MIILYHTYTGQEIPEVPELTIIQTPSHNAMDTVSFTIIAIVSAFFGAIATVLARVLLKELQSKDILAINFFTMGAVLLLLSPLFYHFEPTPIVMALIIIIAFIDTAANYFLFKTFEKTDASVASPLLSLAPAFTFFFSWIFLSDITNIRSFVFSIAIMVLIIIFSIDFSNFSVFKQATLWPAVLSSILFGVSAIPSKYLLSTLHAINAPTLYMFRAGFIAIFAVLLFRFTITNISITQYRVIFFRGLIVIAQWILLYYALSRGNAGVTITLGNITPVFVFFFSTLFLREKPTMKKFTAAILVLVLSLLI
ncbi:DMT family transporter [Candidatus Uhrbacteria bacterium]|nr:DMT family transporter [Candidatus Uhrbacteria bacterium]